MTQFVARAAEPVRPEQRRRLWIELAIVLAFFPAPAAVAAWVALANSVVGNGPGQRFPNLISHHLGLAFPFLLAQLVLELAGAALVLYLLSTPGGDGGPAAIGLDRTNPRGDAALVLPVFLICFVLGEFVLSAVLHDAGVRSVSPSLGSFPGYYQVLYVVGSVNAGIVEEIVVLGYFVRRLEQLGVRPAYVVIAAVALRASYHLYYGWGVIPIIGWALLSVLVYRRYRRLGPFIFVHACWDTGLFLTSFHHWFLGAEVLVLFPVSLVALIMWNSYIPRRPAHRAGGAAPLG